MDLNEEQRRILPHKDDGKPYAFMVVDDSEFMINNLKRIILSFEGEIMDTAMDGATAVVRYKNLPAKPDVITMDLTMPKMGGMEAIKMIMAENPAQKIVVVSALGHKEAVRDAIMLGAKHFIVKPFNRDDVYRVLRAVLGLKPSGGES